MANNQNNPIKETAKAVTRKRTGTSRASSKTRARISNVSKANKTSADRARSKTARALRAATNTRRRTATSRATIARIPAIKQTGRRGTSPATSLAIGPAARAMETRAATSDRF